MLKYVTLVLTIISFAATIYFRDVVTLCLFLLSAGLTISIEILSGKIEAFKIKLIEVEKKFSSIAEIERKVENLVKQLPFLGPRR